ncbi:MAG: D-alanyl-D-alanine carboxypeptidase, partial [Blastocatellia bacterium]
MTTNTIARCSLLGTLLLLLLVWQEPGPRAQSGQKGLAEQVEAVIRADEYRISSWGIAVADATTGEMIYALNPDQLFVPGSVTKLFSGAAALVALGADHRFVTPLHRRGEISPDGTLDGDLILRGSGDPDLSGRTNTEGKLEFTNRDHTYAGLYVAQGTTAELTRTEALAGIDHLARQVATAGIRRIEDLLIDERLFERHESGGSPPFQVSPVVVNDHLIDLTISPGERAGDPARLALRPATSYLQFEQEVKTVAAGEGTLVSVQRLAP